MTQVQLNSLVLGSASFPHCFNGQCHAVQFFGIWGVWAALHRVLQDEDLGSQSIE